MPSADVQRRSRRLDGRLLAALCAAMTMLAIAGCGDGDDAEGSRPPVLWQSGFETGDLRDWESIQQAAPNRVRVVESPVAEGRFAARFEVRPGDRVAKGSRAELLGRGAPGYPDAKEGMERWYGWSTRFSKDDFPSQVADDAVFQIFLQWATANVGPPPVAMTVRGDKLNLRLSTPDNRFTYIWTAPIQRGRWHRFVVHLKFSADPAVGFVELWHDGRKVLQKRKAATLHRYDNGKPAPNYLKLGFYRYPRIKSKQVVYHDAMRIGTSYAAVKPR